MIYIYLSSKDRPNVKAGELGGLTVQPPHKPHAPNAWAGYHQEDQDHYEQALKKYEAALQSAMDSAVKVENVRLATYADGRTEVDLAGVGNSILTIRSRDVMYPLENYKVEFKMVEDEEAKQFPFKKVALITPLQKETPLQKAFKEAKEMTLIEVADLLHDLRAWDGSEPEKLRNLATWFDILDANELKNGKDEVQRDLRKWADIIESLTRRTETK